MVVMMMNVLLAGRRLVGCLSVDGAARESFASPGRALKRWEEPVLRAFARVKFRRIRRSGSIRNLPQRISDKTYQCLGARSLLTNCSQPRHHVPGQRRQPLSGWHEAPQPRLLRWAWAAGNRDSFFRRNHRPGNWAAGRRHDFQARRYSDDPSKGASEASASAGCDRRPQVSLILLPNWTNPTRS